MRKTYFNDIPAYQFHLLQKFSDQIDHAVFSRHGGVSDAPYDSMNVRYGIGDSHKNVDKNRGNIMDALGFDCIVSANQTHSKNVQAVHNPMSEVDNIDALVTHRRGVPIMMQVADCQAILMYDPVRQVVAAVHAGWKGLAKDISGETLKILRMDYNVDASRLLVGIAPSLGPCCAFFTNPQQELTSEFEPYIDSKKRVDLWEFSLAQLQKHGVQKGNIELARVCTQCSGKKDFFSFRRDHGITGRFGVTIALRA